MNIVESGIRMTTNNSLEVPKRYFSPYIVILLAIALFFLAPIAVVTALLLVAINAWNKRQKSLSFSFSMCAFLFIVLDNFLAPRVLLNSLEFYALSLNTFSILTGIYYGICGMILYYVYSMIKSQTLHEHRFLSWFYILPVFISAFVLFYATTSGLNYVSTLFRKSVFPSVYDLIWESQYSKQDDLFNTLIRPEDMEGKWKPYLEEISDNKELQSADWIKQENSSTITRYTRNINGSYEENGKSFLLQVYQYTRQQEIPVTEEDLGHLGLSGFYDIEPLQVNMQLDDSARYQEAKCLVYGGGLETCIVLLGYKHVITKIQVTSSDLSPAAFEALVNTFVSKSSKRILQYESTLR